MPSPHSMHDRADHRALPRIAFQAVAFFGAFVAAAGFNGTSDPLIGLFMPLLFALAGIALWPGLQEGWRVPRSPVVLLLVLFWGYLALSTLWSSVPYISIMFLVLVASLPIVFFTVTMAPRPEQAARVFAAGLTLGWVGLAVWALAQFYILPGTKGTRISAPMLDPNNLAALFNMGMLPAAAWFLVAARRRDAIWALALYALMASATMVTMSRAGLALALGGLALTVVLQRSSMAGGRRERRWRLAVFVLVPLLAYGMVNASSGNKFGHTFSELAQDSAKSPSLIDRTALLEGSLRMLAHHPYGDIGLGNFYYFYPAFRSQRDMSDGFFAHIDPLQLTLETGFPAAILFYALLGAALTRTIRAWRRLPAGGAARVVLAGSFVPLLSLMIHSHMNYNLYMPGILIPAALLLAVWYLATEQAGGMDRRYDVKIAGASYRRAAACVLAVALVLAASWPLRAGLTSRYLNRASVLVQTGGGAEGARILDYLARYGIAQNFSIYETQARLALQDLAAPGLAPDDRAAILKRGLAAMQEARRHNPVFSSFMSLEAQFYFFGDGIAFPDGRAQAQALLEDAVRLSPMDPEAREGLSIVYQAQGRQDDALRVLNEGLNWPRPKGRPDIDYLMIAARAHEASGDHDGAKQLTDMAAERARGYGLPLQPGY